METRARDPTGLYLPQRLQIQPYLRGSRTQPGVPGAEVSEDYVSNFGAGADDVPDVSGIDLII